jgi:hypothetical protein
VSTRAARWLLFLLFALTLPAPMLGPFQALVPPARYVVLASATGAVGVVEGAGGLVLGILALFAVHAVVYLALAWLLAWGLARLLAPLSPGTRRAAVLVACALLLVLALVLEPYRTPFGQAPGGNLLAALW